MYTACFLEMCLLAMIEIRRVPALQNDSAVFFLISCIVLQLFVLVRVWVGWTGRSYRVQGGARCGRRFDWLWYPRNVRSLRHGFVGHSDAYRGNQAVCAVSNFS
jgi:hypothetical protein